MKTHSTTLRFWLDRHNIGDPAATEELIRFSQDRFRRLVRARLRQFDRLRRFEDTDDILVGVQTRIASSLRQRRFETLDGFLQFGATLIRNELIDMTRHYFGPLGAGRHETRPSGNDSAADGRDGAEAPAGGGGPADVDTVIDGLPPEHRQLFQALYYLGLTQQDTADLLKISLSTLKRRWLEARELFVARYGDPV